MPEEDLLRKTLRICLYELTYGIQDRETYNASVKLLFSPDSTPEQLMSFMKNSIGDEILKKHRMTINDRWKI